MHKLNIPDIIDQFEELSRRIYARSGVGCCLHIVLDDPNYDDASVLFCLGEAKQKKHKDCEEMAKLLLKLSFTQRKKLANRDSLAQERKLVYDLFSTPFASRMRIIRKLNLISDEERRDTDITIIKNAVIRARKNGKLETLKAMLGEENERQKRSR